MPITPKLVCAVSGTTSLDDQGKLHAPGNPYEQAKRCLQIIEKALLQLGVSPLIVESIMLEATFGLGTGASSG